MTEGFGTGSLNISASEWGKFERNLELFVSFNEFLSEGPSFDEVCWWLELQGIGFEIEERTVAPGADRQRAAERGPRAHGRLAARARGRVGRRGRQAQEHET